MAPRPSSVALGTLGALGLALAAMALHAQLAGERGTPGRARLVGQLGLSDLALFTEARYTRHPSQADLHSAFQDHPMAFDHFPSGTLVPPPRANFAPLAGETR